MALQASESARARNLLEIIAESQADIRTLCRLQITRK